MFLVLNFFSIFLLSGGKYVGKQPSYISYSDVGYSSPIHGNTHHVLDYEYKINDQEVRPYEYPKDGYAEHFGSYPVDDLNAHVIVESEPQFDDQFNPYHFDDTENAFDSQPENFFEFHSSQTLDEIEPESHDVYNFEGEDMFKAMNEDHGKHDYFNNYQENVKSNDKTVVTEKDSKSTVTLSSKIDYLVSNTVSPDHQNVKTDSIPDGVFTDSEELKKETLNIEETFDGSGDGEEVDNNERNLISLNPATKVEDNLEDSSPIANIVNAVIKSEEDKNLLTAEMKEMFDSESRSFVFNPMADPHEKFQECSTVKNETGNCRYVQHCLLPSVLSSVQNFMDNVCVIEGRFIGVCCPDFPVMSVIVNWPNSTEEFTSKPAETPKDCGVGTNTRIVGGVDADRKAWPWMVALLSDKKFYCGGSLINDRYVLTAAHCTFGVRQNQITARLGEYDFKDPREPHDDYRVIEIKRHGHYTRLTLRNDIALLKLESKVKFNEFIKTICLPKPDVDQVGDTAILIGWGHLYGGSGISSNVLQQASLKIISNDECSEIHGLPIPPSLVCAAAPKKDKSGCNGDSGGPLMFLKDGKWEVVGAVSWGRRGCDTKFPTVYTRVNHFLDWIQKHSR